MSRTKTYFFSFFPFIFLLTSCISTLPTVLTMLTQEGDMQYFVRPERLKQGGAVIEPDFTLRVRKDVIEDPVVANYTLKIKGIPLSDLSGVQVSIITDSASYPIAFEQVFFKNPETGEIRISGRISADNFAKIIHESSSIAVSLDYPPAAMHIVIPSKKLAKKLMLLNNTI